jgi:hypothetical protein
MRLLWVAAPPLSVLRKWGLSGAVNAGGSNTDNLVSRPLVGREWQGFSLQENPPFRREAAVANFLNF